MADWSFVQGLPQAPKTIGPDITEILQAQGLQQKNQLVGSEIQGRNMLARMYQDPQALDPQTGMLKPPYVNMIGQVSPETAMSYMQDAQKLMRSRQLVESEGMEQRQKFVQDFNQRLAPAKEAWNSVIRSGGSPQEAQAAATAAGRPIVDQALAAGDVPSWAQPRMQGWEYNNAAHDANALGRTGAQQLAVKGQTPTEETDTGRTPPVRFLRWGDGRMTDITGQRPYVHSGIAETKAAEDLPMVGKEKGTGADVAVRPSSMSPTGWFGAGNKPIELQGAPHKMSTKAEAEADDVAKPTGPTDLHGQEYLAALPADRAALIKAYAEGRQAFPGSFAQKSKANRVLLADIAQYDPEFDAINYSARSKSYNDLTAGKTRDNLAAINTTIGHMGSLLKSGDALENFREGALPFVQTANTIKNWYNENRGDPRITAFETDKEAVIRELTRVFRGTGGAVADLRDWQKNISRSQSPEQIHKFVEEGLDLLASRLNTTAELVRKGLGTTADVNNLLNPKSQATLRMLPGGEDILNSVNTTVGGRRGEAVANSAAPAAPPAAAAGGPVKLRDGREQEDFDALPQGAEFIGPDGKKRHKP